MRIDIYECKNKYLHVDIGRVLVASQKSIEKKVQVGKGQEKAQSEKDSHSKIHGGKKPN